MKAETTNVEEVKGTDSTVKDETTKPQNHEPKEEKEPKVEEPQESKKEEKTEAEEVKADIEQLRAELKEANEKAGQVETLTATVETMKAEAEKTKLELKEYEELVGNLIETKLKEVPEDYKELIPNNLNLKQKLNWLEKAEAKGLFNKEEKKKPNVEIGKPMNVEAPTVDTSKLTGSQLLRMAYNTVKR